MIKLALTSAALVALAAGAAAAQDISAPPNFGSVNLVSGFDPDPYTVQLGSGGDIDASRSLGQGCMGYITGAPDYSVNYSDSGLFPLVISVRSNSDTTLVVNDSQGNWHCDDDSAGGINPRVVIRNPTDGRIDIWVGSFDPSGGDMAVLGISELE